MRKRIAEVNIEVASSSRVIDDVPTRWELIQYERRFAELSQQIAWKLDEQKKYIAVYNSLANKQSFLSREVKLLNSISENLKDASKSASSRTEFLTQLGTIVKGVEENLKQQESTVSLRASQVETLKSVYQQLVDQQRDYFKAIKDFQEECDKNEWLTSRLEMIAQSSG